MTGRTQPVTLCGVIPDIAFMIVIYGCARLAIATLDPYRRGTGTMAQVATALTWIVMAGGALGLVVLGLMVANSSTSITG